MFYEGKEQNVNWEFYKNYWVKVVTFHCKANRLSFDIIKYQSGSFDSNKACQFPMSDTIK